jgi:hypothetical protein
VRAHAHACFAFKEFAIGAYCIQLRSIWRAQMDLLKTIANCMKAEGV